MNNPLILEYHKFQDLPDDYEYSRTFTDFENDLRALRRSDPDTRIRFDDGWEGQYKAAILAKKYGFSVYIGITTNFIGKPGYMTWTQVSHLALHHIICNHGVSHFHLKFESRKQIEKELKEASDIIEKETGKRPEYYLPTYNEMTDDIKDAANELGMWCLDPVVVIRNKTNIYVEAEPRLRIEPFDRF